jgi:hypothetical protein
MKQRFIIGSLGAVIAAISLASTDTLAQAGAPAAALRGGVEAGAPAAAARQGEGAQVATPRRPNGHPDFTGIWVQTRRRGDVAPAGLDAGTGSFNQVLRNRTNNPVDFERDSGVRQRAVPRDSKPWYKPEYWDRVQFNDTHGHSLQAPDPEFQCMPGGVPRAGMPQEILQTDRHMVFLYPLHIRRIYIDGRPSPPVEQWIGTWFGHSVGRWEGDTLVITTVDFNGLEWLGWPGWFTSPDKKVTERMRRVGNTLEWQATVEDPILLKPWNTGMQRRQLNTDPFAEIEEPLPCVEKDLQHMVTRERG